MLDEQDGCEDWRGTASGNDPSVRLHLQLCPSEAGAVSGRVQWSSLQSGWNVREVGGRWTGARLRLRDLRISESDPRPGWRFCVIDQWRLNRNGDELRGEYHSEACRDRASVRFRRVSEPETNSRSTAPPNRPEANGRSMLEEETPGSPSVGPPPPVDEEARSMFGGCRLGARSRSPVEVGLLVCLALLWLRSFRCGSILTRSSRNHQTRGRGAPRARTPCVPASAKPGL